MGGGDRLKLKSFLCPLGAGLGLEAAPFRDANLHSFQEFTHIGNPAECSVHVPNSPSLGWRTGPPIHDKFSKRDWTAVFSACAWTVVWCKFGGEQASRQCGVPLFPCCIATWMLYSTLPSPKDSGTCQSNIWGMKEFTVDWTWGLIHGEQAPYQWAISPEPLIICSSINN